MTRIFSSERHSPRRHCPLEGVFKNILKTRPPAGQRLEALQFEGLLRAKTKTNRARPCVSPEALLERERARALRNAGFANGLELLDPRRHDGCDLRRDRVQPAIILIAGTDGGAGRALFVASISFLSPGEFERARTPSATQRSDTFWSSYAGPFFRRARCANIR